MLRKDNIYDGTSDLKLEVMSYSDSAYDVTNFFVVLKSSWPILLPSFIVVRPQMVELKRGSFFAPPPSPSITGVSRTPSKLGLNLGVLKKLSAGFEGGRGGGGNCPRFFDRFSSAFNALSECVN